MRARWPVAFTEAITGEGEAVGAPFERQRGNGNGKARLLVQRYEYVDQGEELVDWMMALSMCDVPSSFSLVDPHFYACDSRDGAHYLKYTD